jgi:hypothetical protein
MAKKPNKTAASGSPEMVAKEKPRESKPQPPASRPAARPPVPASKPAPLPEKNLPPAVPPDPAGIARTGEPVGPKEPEPVNVPPVVERPVPPPPPVEAKEPERTVVVEPPQGVLPAKLVFKRRRDLSAEDLRKQLADIREIGLDKLTVENLIKASFRHQKFQGPDPMQALARDNTSVLRWLPTRMGHDCELGKEPSENLQVLSRKLRVHLEAATPKDGIDMRPDPVQLRNRLLGEFTGERHHWVQDEAIPTLLQLLMAENEPMRLLLVEMLAEIPGKEASIALAQRALFDLSHEVRAAAVQYLRSRPADEYRPALLTGLRYPWAPAADHAAETLVALQDRTVVPRLVQMLREPDPKYLVTPSKSVLVREVVRINHLANCILCHQPSFSTNDLVRGLVPTPGQALPAPITTPRYYEGDRGTFVRAQITYLKQDFSVPQPVKQADPWPSHQRFDYLVMTRPITLGELKEPAYQKLHDAQSRPGYEQREAVLFALRELTGKDLGPATAAWEKEFLPQAAQDPPPPAE